MNVSIKTQEKHMRRLAELTSQDLSYIGGERESGPNGAKREFLNTGKTFLRALAKDLGFRESRVSDNPGGIGVGGDVLLMGMWREGNGIYVVIRGENDFLPPVMCRTIRHMKDFTGGNNQWMEKDILRGYYQQMVKEFLAFKEDAKIADAA
jgi:hypothetical protein